MNIEICFTAQELSSPLVYGKTIILLDIFRASSTIITALFNGANNIIPASSLKNALELKKKYPQAILGGEDHGQMVKGFILGNSPLEYTTDIVKNKTVILSTTNGTKTFHLVKDGIKNLYIGSFLNAPAVAKEIIEEENDVLLACAGTQDEYSLEDTCCAGYFLHLLKNIISPHISDRAISALSLYEYFRDNLPYFLSRSKNGRSLLSKGQWPDIEYCCLKNSLSNIPIYCPEKGIVNLPMNTSTDYLSESYSLI